MKRARLVAIALASGCVLAAPPSRADEPAVPLDARGEARELAQKGDQEFSRGRCDLAIRLWTQAEAKFHAPTILVRVARCHALMGRVVEAAGVLEKVAGDALPADAPAPFLEAKQQAESELPGVRERIAELTLRVRSADPSAVAVVEIDDARESHTQRVFRLDPGTHRLRVRASGASWEQRFVLADGERKTIDVALQVEKPSPPARTQRTVGFVLGAAGIASVVAGSFFGISAASTSSDLEAVCGADRAKCPTDQEDTISRLKTHALVADLLVGGGVALLAAGGVVVLTEPKPKQEAPRIKIVARGLGAALVGGY